MPRALKCYLLCLLGVCFADVALSLALVVGVEATPWTTTDSQGRAMGFNDPFSLEHYRIALGNIRPEKLFRAEVVYEEAVLVAILVGVWCLGSEGRWARAVREWYFFIQLLVFAPGVVGLLFWPGLMLDVISFQADREFFVDMPAGLILTVSPWVLLCVTICLVLHADASSGNETPQPEAESEGCPLGESDLLSSH